MKKRLFCILLKKAVPFALALLVVQIIISIFNHLLSPYEINKISTATTTFKFKKSDEKYRFKYQIYGAIPSFICKENDDDEGPFYSDRPLPVSPVRKIITGEVESSVLLHLNGQIKEEFGKMFSARIKNEKWFHQIRPIQASCNFLNSSLFCVLRLWFNLNLSKSIPNRYQDSYLVLMEIGENLQIKQGSLKILGIPVAVNDINFNGPEDPRLIIVNGSLFIDFNTGQIHQGIDETVRRLFLWSLPDSRLYDIEIENYKMNLIEKNWPPLVGDDGKSLFYIYQMLPFTRILKCQIDNLLSCHFVAGEPDFSDESVKTRKMLLRGGSPFVHYKSDYFLSATHSLQWLARGRIYASQLTLLNLKTNQIVFVTSPILFETSIQMKMNHSNVDGILFPFFYARSIFIERDENSLILAGGLNDYSSSIIKLKGVTDLLGTLIGMVFCQLFFSSIFFLRYF